MERFNLRHKLNERQIIILLSSFLIAELVFFLGVNVVVEKSLLLGLLSFFLVLYLSLLFFAAGIKIIFLFLSSGNISEVGVDGGLLIYTLLWIIGFLLWCLALRKISQKFKPHYYFYALFLAVLTGVVITLIFLKVWDGVWLGI